MEKQKTRVKSLLYISLAIVSVALMGYFGTYFVASVIRRPYKPTLPAEIQSRITEVSNPGQMLWVDHRFLLLTARKSIDPELNTEEEDNKSLREETEELSVLEPENKLYDQNWEILRYDTFNDKIETIGEIHNNQVIGLTSRDTNLTAVSEIEDNLLVCTWENYEISSPDEIATKITIANFSGEILDELEFSETIRPLNCDAEVIHGKSAYPFMMQEFFTIDVRSRQIELVENILEDGSDLAAAAEFDYDSSFYGYSVKQTGEELSSVFNANNDLVLEFNYYDQIARFYVSPDEKSVAYVNPEGEIGFYLDLGDLGDLGDSAESTR
ncbi:hypothetical protein GF357_04395 [Candidatus Dojkabacteria bacterium]|nr:hypothetical protein [Candidatus Dojkabacteria bacterium]